MVALCKCLGKANKAEKEVEAEAPKAEEIAEGVVADKKAEEVEAKDGEEAADVKEVEVEEKKDDDAADAEAPAVEEKAEEAPVEEEAAAEA